VVQIPAFLCRQTDLVMEVSRHARAVNVIVIDCKSRLSPHYKDL